MRDIEVLKRLLLDEKFRVYSRQCFYNIILPNYTNKYSNYSLVYGDIDGLWKANQAYGEEEADKGINFIIEEWRKSLPEGSIIARTGGDEFIALNPNKDKEKCEEHTAELNARIAEASNDKTKGLAISLAIEDSKYSDNIADVLLSASGKLDQIKLDIKYGEYLKMLEDKDTDEAIKKMTRDLFKEIRAYKEKDILETEDIQNLIERVLGNLIITATAELEQKTNSEILLNIPSKNLEAYQFDVILDMGKEEATDFIVSESSLDKLIELLSRNNNNGFYNKAYFENKIFPKLKGKSYSIINLSLVGIKMSNTVIGHEATDKKFKDISDLLNVKTRATGKSQIEGEEERDEDLVVDYGGGNYIIILPKTSLLDAIRVDKRICKNLEGVLEDRTLDLVTAVTKVDESGTFEEALQITEARISLKKPKVKVQQLASNPNLDFILQKFLKDVVKVLCNQDVTNLSIESLTSVATRIVNYGILERTKEQVAEKER